jgi:hypothetical protein
MVCTARHIVEVFNWNPKMKWFVPSVSLQVRKLLFSVGRIRETSAKVPVSFVMSEGLSVRMKQLGFRWRDFSENHFPLLN